MTILRDNALRHIEAMPEYDASQKGRKSTALKVVLPFYDRGYPEKVWPVAEHTDDMSGDLMTKVLKTFWSIEAIQDAMAATGLDITEAMLAVIYDEVVAELLSIREELKDEGKQMVPYIPVYIHGLIIDETTFEPKFTLATQYISR